MSMEINTGDFDLKVGDIVSLNPIDRKGDYSKVRGKFGRIKYDAGFNKFDPSTVKYPERQFRYRVLMYEPMWSSLSKIQIWADNFAFCELKKVNLSPEKLNTLRVKQRMLMILDDAQHMLMEE
jgi:hypothetical protein